MRILEIWVSSADFITEIIQYQSFIKDFLMYCTGYVCTNPETTGNTSASHFICMIAL